ncbi:MAG: anti-sigma factor [Proteobacteria bacterium]|nr:anti-sigma factor [Pseudomonadota bacterium]
MTDPRAPEPDDPALDVLAGEYVLGTLRGAERQAFEARLAREPTLRAQVRAWEDRFAPLGLAVAPVAPPATLWPAIERALAPPALAPAPRARLWDSVALWRNLAFGAGALAVLALAIAGLLTVPLAERGPTPRPAVAVLVDDARQAAWLALANPAGTRLELRALKTLAPPAGRAFELWLIAGPGEPPRSLGLLPPEGRAIEQLPVLLRPGATLAITVEPASGSPTGAPTGPVVLSGTVIATDGPPPRPAS